MFLRQGTFRFFHPANATSRPLVGISACLTGEPVRYDGTDKRLDTLETVQREVELQEVCPESRAGLGIPREPVRLELSEHGLRAMGVTDSSLDVTETLLQQRSQYLRTLRGQPLCGFILKSRSPSCGFASTPVFVEGESAYLDNGLFTDGLIRLYPWLAICDERQLTDTSGLERFAGLCRLVQDILFTTPAAPLPELHRHYAAQFAEEPHFPGAELQACVDRDDRQSYVQTLMETARYNPEDWRGPA